MTKETIHANAFTCQAQLRSRLKTLAERAGSVRKLAQAAGLSQSTVQSYFDRGSEPTASALLALAKAGNVSVDWLLGEDSPAIRLADHVKAIGERGGQIAQTVTPEPPVDRQALEEMLSSIYKRVNVALLLRILDRGEQRRGWNRLSERERVRRVLSAYENFNKRADETAEIDRFLSKA